MAEEKPLDKVNLIDLLVCPFCGDKMKSTRSIINVDRYDAVRHRENNNKCPVGRGIYRLKMWQQRSRYCP